MSVQTHAPGLGAWVIEGITFVPALPQYNVAPTIASNDLVDQLADMDLGGMDG